MSLLLGAAYFLLVALVSEKNALLVWGWVFRETKLDKNQSPVCFA